MTISGDLSLEPCAHPDRLAVAGRLAGLPCASPRTASVLEIGCGDGTNLLPCAWHLRGARFVGIDSDARSIAVAIDNARETGCDNVSFLCETIDDHRTRGVTYDYVILRQVLAFIPAGSRAAVLRAVTDVLDERGVLFLSYPSRAGWASRSVLRDVLRRSLPDGADATSSVSIIRKALAALHESPFEAADPFTRVARFEIGFARSLDDSELGRLFLTPAFEPLLFSEVAATARMCCLIAFEHARDSNDNRAVEDELKASLADALGHRDVAEDLFDYLFCPQRRADCFCHARALGMGSFAADATDLLYAADLTTRSEDVALEPEIEAAFRTSTGKLVTTKDTLNKLLLHVLRLAWPNALALEELLTRSRNHYRDRTGRDLEAHDDEAAVRERLLAFHRAGFLHLRAYDIDSAVSLPELPEVFLIHRWQARRGTLLTGPYHNLIAVDAFTQRLIGLLDGTRDHETLTRTMLEALHRGELLFQKKDSSEPDEEEFVTKATREALAHLARAGLLAPASRTTATKGTT